jgi:predicted RNA binding protein YcfA (HicA-like mRNA interferase family)
MKIPRDISGRQLVKVLCREFGYHKVHQEGSHIVLETEDPSHQRWQFQIMTLCELVR